MKQKPLPGLDEVGDPLLAGIWADDKQPLDFLEGYGGSLLGHGRAVPDDYAYYVYRVVGGYGPKQLYMGAYALDSEIDSSEVDRLILAAWIGLGILALSLVVAVVLGRKIARPVGDLAEAARAVSTFDFRRVPPAKRSAFRELDSAAGAFNSMLSGLRWFETYVPRSLVLRLIHLGENGVQSEERQVTVIFTDIVGFTAASQKLTPRETADFLNHHFALLAAEIEETGGTVDKYIGDSVMAFWGAPDDQPDHAERACRAALAIDAALARVAQVLNEDPLFADDAAGQQEFCTYFDLGSGFGELVDRVQSLVQARAEKDHLARTAKQSGDEGKPLDLSNLATIQKAIAQADLSGMTSRQAICEVGADGRPVPLFYELFTSIGALRQTLMPDQNFFSDRWLFQYLTTKLDERMLAWLTKNDDSTLKRSFSLNINIASVLSPRFLEFDALLDKERRNTIVIELQKIDVFADIARFLFCRDFLLDRGYRICLDGLTALSLPFMDRRTLGFELVKMHWTPQLRQQIEGKDGERLREAIKATNPRRIIMMRCESDDAIELGHELGISLFQGYFLDHLLSEKITREEAAERLSAALARHRRVAGQPQTATGA